VIEHYDAAWNELTAPGAQFAMSEIEVRGAPMRVFDAAPPTMRSFWELAVDVRRPPLHRLRGRAAHVRRGRRGVRALAHLLHDRYGVGHGDRVAIAMRNYPEWVVAYWATVSIGAAVVGMNAWWTSAEMAYGLGDSRRRC
jgi:long-chain acyl-CoA synthetase